MIKLFYCLSIIVIFISCNRDKDLKLAKTNFEKSTNEYAIEQLTRMIDYSVFYYKKETNNLERFKIYDSCNTAILENSSYNIKSIDSNLSNNKVIIDLIDSHIAFNKKIINRLYKPKKENGGLSELVKYYNEKCDKLKFNDLKQILVNDDDKKQLMLVIKLRLLLFDYLTINTISSTGPDIDMVSPRIEIIGNKDTIFVGQEYFARIIFGVNYSEYFQEFKIDEVYFNGQEIDSTKYSINRKKGINFSFIPNSNGTLIYKGYIKYRNPYGIQIVPFERKVLVKKK